MAGLRDRVVARIADLERHKAALVNRHVREIAGLDAQIAQLQDSLTALTVDVEPKIEPLLDERVLPEIRSTR